MHLKHAAAPISPHQTSVTQDPTGTMGAALHNSVLQQAQQPDQQHLGPGCVMLLQRVSVLTPSPGSSYLAVTAANIVKVKGRMPVTHPSHTRTGHFGTYAYCLCSMLYHAGHCIGYSAV